MVDPDLMPSFATKGLPEYPATSTALYRPLPPLPPFVHHPPDPARGVVRDIQRAVRAHGHAHRPVLRARGVFLPESIRERLICPNRLTVLERHEHDAVAGLGQRRPVPGAVERHEGPRAIPRGKLGPAVERQPIRRPVRRKHHQGLLLVLAASHLLAVAAVLGREHQVPEYGVVVTVRPAVIVPL